MRSRTLPLVLIIGLVLVACGDAADTTTTTGQSPTTTAVVAPPEAPEAMHLSYTLEPGTTFSYEVDFDQHFDLATSGDPGVMDEEGIPGELAIRLTGTTVFDYSVAQGPEPGTYELTITGDLSGLEFSGTVDGVPADPEDALDLAGMEPFETTVIVDDQGNPIGGGEDPDDLLGGLFGGLQAFGDPGAAGMDPGRFVGPPLPDDEVTVGDSWTETVEIPLLDPDNPATSTVSSVVSRAETLEGFHVLVIDTVTNTSAISFDLAELFIGMFEAFMPPDASPEDLAEFDTLIDGLRFLFEVDASEHAMTTWFDPEAGVSRAAEFAGSGRVTMDLNMPDEETGEMTGFVMVMNVTQSMTFRLVD